MLWGFGAGTFFNCPQHTLEESKNCFWDRNFEILMHLLYIARVFLFQYRLIQSCLRASIYQTLLELQLKAILHWLHSWNIMVTVAAKLYDSSTYVAQGHYHSSYLGVCIYFPHSDVSILDFHAPNSLSTSLQRSAKLSILLHIRLEHWGHRIAPIFFSVLVLYSTLCHSTPLISQPRCSLHPVHSV